MGQRDQEALLDRLHESFDLPEEIRTPRHFVESCLEDLFFLCAFVLRHGKKLEYRDLNRIHLELCDFLTRDPNPQKLVLMSRDSLKSTVGRGAFLQKMLKHLHAEDEVLLGIVTGLDELSQEHLSRIEWELLSNDLLQAFFAGTIPSRKTDAASFTPERFRFRRVGVDTGSLKKSLTGKHYLGVWNDNLMNEINSSTADLRKWAVTRWRQQESILAENAWEWVFETPWEADDVSGLILDPDGKFNYRKIYRKSPAIFISETGYSVFSCFVRNEKGELNFPEKIDEAYLSRKRKKQGLFIYLRMYEGQILDDDEVMVKPKFIRHYDALPYPFIRNIAVDCAGTKKKSSSHSGVSIGDWGADETLYIPYAMKRKVSPMELFRWVCELWDRSVEEDRAASFVVIEEEKYGIFLASLLESERPDITPWPMPIRGRTRDSRLMSTIPYFEQRKILSKKGLEDYEDELKTWRKGKEVGTDLFETVYLHLQSKLVPKPLPADTGPLIEDDFAAQVRKDLERQHLHARPDVAEIF